MAGGAGGGGASPNGVSGFSGVLEPQGTTQSVIGGAGGNNGLLIIDGSNTYGPYGAGGAGGSVRPASVSSTQTGQDGQGGAVILVWGGGDSQSALVQEVSNGILLTATSSGYGSGGGGPNEQPGYQYDTSNSNGVLTSYAPVSTHYAYNTNWGWSRSLAFTGPNTSITNTDLNNWGFDPSDVVSVTSLSLENFSAGVDSSWIIGYALITHGASDIRSASGFTTLGELADSIPDRHYRISNIDPYSGNDNGGQSPYGLGPWQLPIPATNQLLYLWSQSGSGTDTRKITVKYSYSYVIPL